MSDKKQIDEMARKICRNYQPNGSCATDDDPCHLECVYGYCAERIYCAGYRKQREGEWVKQVKIRKQGVPILHYYQCSLCGVYLVEQANYCPNCGAKMKGADNDRAD